MINNCENIFRGIIVSKDSKNNIFLKQYIENIYKIFGTYDNFKNNIRIKKFIIDKYLLKKIKNNKNFINFGNSKKSSFYFNFEYIDFEKVFINSGVLFSKDKNDLKVILIDFLENEEKYKKTLDKFITEENDVKKVVETQFLNNENIFDETSIEDTEENILFKKDDTISNEEEVFTFNNDDDEDNIKLILKPNKLSYTVKEYDRIINLLKEKEKTIKDLIIYLIDKDKFFSYQNEYSIKNIINKELLYILKNKSVNDDEISFSFDDIEDIKEVPKEKTYTKQEYEFIIKKINDKNYIIKEFIKFLIEKNMMNKDIQSIIKKDLMDILNS